MGSAIIVAKKGTYAEFCSVYDPATTPFDLSLGAVGLLGQAVVNPDPSARVAITNRLLDDGADPAVVSTNGDGVNVLHMLWGRERERDPEPEAALVSRLLDGGADINLRSPRFGLPLVCLSQGILATPEYLRAVFAAVVAHSRPDLTAHVDNKRESSVGQSLARTRFGAIREEVLAYAAESGQDIDLIT